MHYWVLALSITNHRATKFLTKMVRFFSYLRSQSVNIVPWEDRWELIDLQLRTIIKNPVIAVFSITDLFQFVGGDCSDIHQTKSAVSGP